MSKPRHYGKGDVVVHPKRPEWGRGVVQQARKLSSAEGAGQRLVVDFTHRGRITLNTEVAPLLDATAAARRRLPEYPKTMDDVYPLGAPHGAVATGVPQPPETKDRTGTKMTTQTMRTGQGWLEALEKRQSGDQLMQLPEALSDPFESLYSRLKMTLDTYRYSREARSLIEWAIAQTGMEDPLSSYTRSELERAFPYYCGNRDQHLRELVRTAKRENRQEMLAQLKRETTNPAASKALAQAMKG